MFQWALETFDKVQDQISQHVAPPPTDGPGRFAYNVQRNDEDAAMGCVYEMDPVFTVVNQSKGWYPIHLACQYSQIRLIRLLFTQPGMNVEQADMNGNTPLHHACMGRDMKAMETVQMLVKEYGADVCAKNSQGHTPYDLAVINSVRQFLLPIQLQKETQIALDNGGQGLPPGIDLGGLRIKNSTMAPPPMTFGSPPPPQQPQQQPSQPQQPHMFDTPTPKNFAAPTPSRIASAPASSPAIPQPQQIGGYSRVGSSSAAIFSDKYRADGFHSSSSDVGLQQKYGHDPSISRTHHVTAPPPSSGNSSTMGSITSPMNATTPSSSSMHGGANPFSASSHLGQRYVAYGPAAAAAPAPTSGFVSPNYSPAVAAAPMQNFSTFTPSPSAGMNNDTIPAPAPASAPTTPYMPPPPYQSQPYQTTSTPLTNKRPDFISPAAATHGGSPVTPITPGNVISPSSGESAHDLFSAPPSGGGTPVSTENAKELFSATTPSTIAAAPVSGESVQDVFAAPSPSNTITTPKEEEEEKVSETPEKVTVSDDLAAPTPEANPPEPIPEDTAVTETTVVESTQEVATQHETVAPVEEEQEPTNGGNDDWVEAVDPSSGKTYYYNHVTNETSWENPKASVEATTAESDSGNDWEEILDPSSNTIYYYNKVTQETSWEKPAGSSSTVQSETKESGNDEWVEHTDPSSGQTYYYNTTTQETSWEKPITESSSNSQAEPAAATSSKDDWIETVDPSSGQTYYYNQVTQETSWEKPQALAVAATNESETNESTEPVHDATAAEEPAQEPQKLNEAQTSGDWIESTDPATGNTYYYNQVTQETSWEKPQTQTVSTEDTPLDEEPSSLFPAKTQTDKIVIEEAPKSNQSAVSAEELFGADPLSTEQPVFESPNEQKGDQPVNTPSEPAETPDAPETKDEKEADEATGDDGEMLDVPLSPENGKQLVAPKVERSEDLFAAIGMPPPPFQSKR